MNIITIKIQNKYYTIKAEELASLDELRRKYIKGDLERYRLRMLTSVWDVEINLT